MLVSILGLAALLLTPVSAVFVDEAWNTDYHYALLGLPKQDTTFFHQPNPASKASLIYTLSERGVLGAVNPRDGTIVWRQMLADSNSTSPAGFLRATEGQSTVVSGIEKTVAAWSASEGRLVWESEVPGHVVDLEILELSDSSGSKDAIVLSHSDTSHVQRIDGQSGAIKWTFNVEGGDTPYQVSASTTEVFVIFLHKTMLGYIKIKVVTLDSVTGRKKDEYSISSDSELASSDTIVSVGANSASPIIAWTDAAFSVLKVNIIGTKSVASFELEKRANEPIQHVHLHAPFHSNSLAHFLVHYEAASSHWADVFHINLPKSTVERAYQLPRAPGKGAFSTSTSDANVYFSRVTSDEVTVVSSASHGILGKWPVSNGFGTAAGDAAGNQPVRVVSDISVKGDAISAIRSAVLLASGDWVMLRDGSPVWQRPEVLATTMAAAFAIPHGVQDLVETLEKETHSDLVTAYLHRTTRHLQELRRLPEVLAALPQRVINGFLGTTADAGLESDTFGFHQIIACAVSGGRVVALDAGSPSNILWTRQVGAKAWQPKFEESVPGTIALILDEADEPIYLNATTGLPVDKPPMSTIRAPEIGSITFSLAGNALQAKKVGSQSTGALWQFEVPYGYRITDLVPRPVNDPVASIGKVLGDRRVLYKFLSPNLALVTASHEEAQSAAFYVLDTVSGATLYSSLHEHVDLSEPISTIMSENWFAIAYTSDAFAESPKGHQLVVGEMFESLAPNDRGPLDKQTNVSSLKTQVQPYVLTKTYQIPEVISKLSVTKTLQGITSRQLLAILRDSDSIVGIPYPILDPRRPAGRDPTKDEQAEGLMRYAPVIEFDPKWYLNHRRDVIGVREIVTSPALIESTSLIFAYGLDIFGTRLSPSFSFDILGKNFNKFQMLATVAALAVATFVVAPLVARKQVNARWRLM